MQYLDYIGLKQYDNLIKDYISESIIECEAIDTEDILDIFTEYLMSEELLNNMQILLENENNIIL